jgi:hypothetical protein
MNGGVSANAAVACATDEARGRRFDPGDARIRLAKQACRTLSPRLSHVVRGERLTPELGDARLRARKEERAGDAGDDRRRAPVAWIGVARAPLLLFTYAGVRREPIARRRTPGPRPERARATRVGTRAPRQRCSRRVPAARLRPAAVPKRAHHAGDRPRRPVGSAGHRVAAGSLDARHSNRLGVPPGGVRGRPGAAGPLCGPAAPSVRPTASGRRPGRPRRTPRCCRPRRSRWR